MRFDRYPLLCDLLAWGRTAAPLCNCRMTNRQALSLILFVHQTVSTRLFLQWKLSRVVFMLLMSARVWCDVLWFGLHLSQNSNGLKIWACCQFFVFFCIDKPKQCVWKAQLLVPLMAWSNAIWRCLIEVPPWTPLWGTLCWGWLFRVRGRSLGTAQNFFDCILLLVMLANPLQCCVMQFAVSTHSQAT